MKNKYVTLGYITSIEQISVIQQKNRIKVNLNNSEFIYSNTSNIVIINEEVVVKIESHTDMLDAIENYSSENGIVNYSLSYSKLNSNVILVDLTNTEIGNLEI